ncbi:MAG: peptidylprolyl isomerase [Desulfuromonas sp.]|nr:MAG: peptidylprolyl isomerase [Desulfuromonas sp.]
MLRHIVVISLSLALLAGCSKHAAEQAVISTTHGDIVIELHEEQAPKTVANFKKLAREGFYNGLTFHRVVPGFVVQGGDPAGNGTGGPGYTVEAEIDPALKHLTGTVATARLGDRANPERRSSGSQFYICLAPQQHLDGGYTIFGQVIEGMDAVKNIRKGDKMEKVEIR